MKSMKIEQYLKKCAAKFDHVTAHFSSLLTSQKEKNKLLWLKCLLNVIIKHQLSFFGGVVRLPPYKNERHQLVTFTDGSDMYIHFKVLYIAVMLGIVQKRRINHANDVHLFDYYLFLCYHSILYLNFLNIDLLVVSKNKTKSLSPLIENHHFYSNSC